MRYLIRLLAVGSLFLLLGVSGITSARADDTNSSLCTAGLTIFSSSLGTVTTSGNFIFFRNSGVAGTYTSGFLAGYTLSGSQDIVINTATKLSQVAGSYVAFGSRGTLTIRYAGQVNLNNGATSGIFSTVGGTQSFRNFHWSGAITGQLVNAVPPTFITFDVGACSNS